MSVDYNTSVLVQRLQIVIDAIDAGPSNGWMRIVDTGNNILSSLQLARPMGTIIGTVIYFNGLSIIDPAAAATGVATGARCETSDGTVVVSGLTVGLSSDFDIVISPSRTITAGHTVALTAATITGN